MKALTLTQPWATLIASGAKTIETRSWSTRYRGPLAIHAGKGIGEFESEGALWVLALSEPFRTALADADIYNPGTLPRGAIVATCHLVSIEEMLPGDQKMDGIWRIIGSKRMCWLLTNRERAFGDFSAGRFAWLLADVRSLATPIPARGQLGLWEWTPPEGFGTLH